MLPQRLLHFVTALVVVTAMTTIVIPTAAASSVPARSVPHTHTAESLAAIKAAPAGLTREVFGFALASSLGDATFGYPSWNFSLLGTVAFFGLHVNWDGTIVADSGWNVWNSSLLTGLLQTAHAKGTKVVVTIILQDFQPGTPNMCAGLINRAVTVAQTVAQVTAKGVDGVNVDYEGLNGTCQNGLTSRSMVTDFARQLRAALPSTAYLSVDTYASSATDPLGFFDVAGLNSYVDSFFVMAYDLEYSNWRRAPLGCASFCLGPTAPLTGYYYNDTSTASQYVAVVPASKVILGVPYYGRKSCVSAAAANVYPNGSVTADSYLDAITESSDPAVQPGTYSVHRDANDPAGQERWDTWYNASLGCTRELYWDDAASLGAKYDLVNADGLRGVGIWTLNYGGAAPELWAALAGRFGACRAVAVSQSPATTAPIGTVVSVSGNASGCPNPGPLYAFFVLNPGSSTWQLAQAYSTSPTLHWNTAGKPAGTYRFSVWIHDAGDSGVYSNSLGRYDAFNADQYFTLTPSCTSVSVSATPSSSAAVGSVVAVGGKASGCANPEYQFWILNPGSGTWQLAQDYSSSPTFSWNTASKPAGSYRFSVWVRDGVGPGAYTNSLGTYDAFNAGEFFTLISTPCTAVSVSAAPSPASMVGTSFSVSGKAAGCPNALYAFFILYPGTSTWQLAQAYSTSPTLSWNTVGKPAGSYRFSVWVRDVTSVGVFTNPLGSYDAFNVDQYLALTAGCVSISVSAAPSSAAAAGTPVTITGAASGCASPNPLYAFFILNPGSGTWQLAQAYSTSPTFSWNNAGKSVGTYRFSVWVHDAGNSGVYSNSLGRYDAFNADQYFTLTPSCTSVTVSATPSSAVVGTMVAVSGKASGCANPEYQFWILNPGSGTWQLAQDYSSSPTFSWNTAGKPAGTYRFSVWVRDAGSPGVYTNSLGRYDAFNAGQYFTLT